MCEKVWMCSKKFSRIFAALVKQNQLSSKKALLCLDLPSFGGSYLVESVIILQKIYQLFSSTFSKNMNVRVLKSR